MEPERAQFDVIVIGGGPAGLSAAMWCDELGLKTLLLEKEREFGGQLLRVYNPIENYPGIDTMNGREMRDRIAEQVSRRGFLRKLGAAVASVDPAAKKVMLETGVGIIGKSIIIATGVRRRVPEGTGEERFRGSGVLESGKKESHLAAGKRAVVIGGGDAAIENALILAGAAEKVFVVHRRGEFTAREEFMNRARIDPKIEFLTKRTLVSIEGNGRVESVLLNQVATGATEQLPVDIVLIRMGVVPNTDLFGGGPDLDGSGFILINSSCETSETGVFAAGDVSNPFAPTVSSAVGAGANAARAAYHYLTG
jgi:thioredoxin reductase (NADPH)